MVGTIGIYRRKLRRSTRSRSRLLNSFASQAVIAIENTRLLKELRQRTDDLSQSLDDLRTAQDRLVQTEKLASLGQLTAGIAHEIKNPLNFVNNFAALSAELTDELNDVLKQADDRRKDPRGSRRTDRAAEGQSAKRWCSTASAPTPSSRTCCCIRAKGAAITGPPTSTRWSMKASTSPITAPAPRSRTSMLRCSATSTRRRHDRGVSAGNHPRVPEFGLERLLCRDQTQGCEPASPASIRCSAPTTRNLGDSVEIRIRDNGTGIPPEVKDKMFNPFFTTKPAGEGTGLGLSMSHDIIVKQHGGTIDVDTEPGQFTEFRIVLPRTSNFPDKNRGQT